jgi:hypothetical protein
MTREDLELEICARLSAQRWHDVTGERNIDPEAAQCYAFGYDGKRNGSTIWFLNRYEDDGDEYALVCTMRGETKRVSMEQFKLEWLWEQITAGVGTEIAKEER